MRVFTERQAWIGGARTQCETPRCREYAVVKRPKPLCLRCLDALKAKAKAKA